MKTDIKFTVNARERAFCDDATKTTEGRINIERQKLEDELAELQQVEEQLAERAAAINSQLALLDRIAR